MNEVHSVYKKSTLSIQKKYTHYTKSTFSIQKVHSVYKKVHSFY